MAIIIKSLDTVAPVGAKKLYRDALVSNGTLGLIDFSNKGSQDNIKILNGETVNDLSREASKEIGVINNFQVVGSPTSFTLTDGMGFATLNREGSLNVNQLNGLSFGKDISNKIPTGGGFLWSVWLRRKIDGDTATPVIRTADNGDNFKMSSFKNEGFTVSFGGGSHTFSTSNRDGELLQLSLLYNGVGQKPTAFFNGTIADSFVRTEECTGFIPNIESVIGTYEGALGVDIAVYRMIFEDLNISDRLAAQVVALDYEYVTGIGRYEGIQPRPFVHEY